MSFYPELNDGEWQQELGAKVDDEGRKMLERFIHPGSLLRFPAMSSARQDRSAHNKHGNPTQRAKVVLAAPLALPLESELAASQRALLQVCTAFASSRKSAWKGELICAALSLVFLWS